MNRASGQAPPRDLSFVVLCTWPTTLRSQKQISWGLEITSTATDQHSKTLQRNMTRLASDLFVFLLSFDRNNIFYCVQNFFLWSIVFVWLFVGGKYNSFCRLYIHQYVNNTNGIVGILCGNAWFYQLRMKIKAQVKGYVLALLAGSFVGYCTSLCFI